MKKILTGILMMISLSGLAKEIEVKVNGMVCSMCAQGIQKKFKGHSEVKNIEVDLDKKLVKIETHGDKDLNDKVINSLIQEAGYNVAGIERK